MPSVVILHAAEDALPARALAEKLRQAKLTPVIETGSGDAAREAVKSAVVTIALWSPRSVTQQALAEDAAFARGKSKLLHATMQSAQPPEQFRNDKPIDLTGWRGEDDFAPWRALADQVTSKAGVAPLPPPAPRPPSGFFQPGRVDPTAEAAVQANAPKNGPRLERPGHMPPPNLPPVKHQQERGAQPQTPPTAQAPRPAQAPPQRAAAPPQRAAAPPPRAAAATAEREPAKKGGAGGLIIGVIVFVVIAIAGGAGYFFLTQQNQTAATEQTAPSAADVQQAFDAAYAENTIEAMQAFLAAHPNSALDMRARGRIAELQSAAAAAPVTAAPIEAPPEEAASTTPAPAPETAAEPQTGGPASIAPPTEATPPQPDEEGAPGQ